MIRKISILLIFFVLTIGCSQEEIVPESKYDMTIAILEEANLIQESSGKSSALTFIYSKLGELYGSDELANLQYGLESNSSGRIECDDEGNATSDFFYSDTGVTQVTSFCSGVVLIMVCESNSLGWQCAHYRFE